MSDWYTEQMAIEDGVKQPEEVYQDENDRSQCMRHINRAYKAKSVETTQIKQWCGEHKTVDDDEEVENKTPSIKNITRSDGNGQTHFTWYDEQMAIEDGEIVLDENDKNPTKSATEGDDSEDENDEIDNFELISRLGNGTYGVVYKAINHTTGEILAAKMEPLDTTKTLFLEHESQMYSALHGGPGIPNLHYYCPNLNGYNVLLMDLLGPTLYDLFGTHGQKFSLKTILMLADQLLSGLEFIHDRHIIHRDLKPDNMVMGAGDNKSKLYIIDFGLAKYYRDPITGVHDEYGRDFQWGTMFGSLYAALGRQQSRRDDLESIGFVLIYFLKGSLPWEHVWRDREEVIDMKYSTSIDVLGYDKPEEFTMFLKHCRKLSYQQRPNYEMLKTAFRRLFSSMNYSNDGVYDWS